MLFFFFNDTATTEIYTLSLHDALPIYAAGRPGAAMSTAFLFVFGLVVTLVTIGAVGSIWWAAFKDGDYDREQRADRKSTRLNSSHANISLSVFRLIK